jgi:hypothetical protein
MDDLATGDRPPTVFAAFQLAAGAAAAVGAFLLAIALLMVAAVLEEAGKLGHQVSQAIQEVIDTGQSVILENIDVIEDLSRAVDQCKRRSQNPTSGCLEAHSDSLFRGSTRWLSATSCSRSFSN